MESKTYQQSKTVSDDATVVDDQQLYSRLHNSTFKETNFNELLNQPQETLTYTLLTTNRPELKEETIPSGLSITGKDATVSSINSSFGQKLVIEKRDSTAVSTIKLPLREKVIDETCFLHLNGGLLFINSEQKNVIVHQKIYEHFGKKCVDKIAVNQTVIFGDSRSSKAYNRLQTELDIVDFLKESKQFKHIENIEKIAEGGEAIVYKINYVGFDEVVLKIPKQKHANIMNTAQKEAAIEGFEDLICESQLIKSIYHEDYTVEVKEEIIEIDVERNQLIRYCVIVERARYSLYDLYSFKSKDGSSLERTGLWFNKQQSVSSLEKFSIPKFFYYFFQSAQALQYLHSIGIIYSDFKPQNLLVMRNQKIKLGDFGVSILVESQRKNYNMKGLSPQWCIPEIKEMFGQCMAKRQLGKFYKAQWNLEQLKLNDIFALCLTFSSELVRLLIPSSDLKQEDNEYINFFGELGTSLALKRDITLEQMLAKVNEFLFKRMDFFFQLIQLLRDEKKFEAAYEIGKYLKNYAAKEKCVDEKSKSLFFSRIFKIMGEFQYYQGNYKQSFDEIKEAMMNLEEYLPQAKSKEVKEQLACLQYENMITQCKNLINLGHIQQAEKDCETLISNYQKSDHLKSFLQYKLMHLEVQGLIEITKGNYQKAMPLYEEYAKILDECSIEYSIYSNKISSFLKLGDIYYKQKDFSGSLKYYLKAQQHLKQEYGENHPLSLDCLKSIGNIYLQADQLDKANQNFNQALLICQNIFGEKNVQTAETYRQIGDLYNKKQNEKGIFYYQKAQAIYEFLYGEDNIHCAVIFNNLGGLLEQLGAIDQAEQMCLKALKIKAGHHGEDVLDLSNIYQNLCQIKIKQQQIHEALKYIQNAYDIKLKLQGIDHLDTLQTIHQYIRLLAVCQKYQEALQLGLNAYDLGCKKHGKSNFQMVLLRQFLGQCYLKAGLADQAVECLLDAWEQIKKNGYIGAEEQLQYELLKDIGMAYETKKDLSESIQFFQQALKLCKNPNEKFGILRSISFNYAKSQKLQEALTYANQAQEVLDTQLEGVLAKEVIQKFSDQLTDLKTNIQKVVASQKNFKQ